MMLTINKQLAEMLKRKLRVDRHPRHAAEVRENLLPRMYILSSFESVG
jgi:hypothetical protein